MNFKDSIKKELQLILQLKEQLSEFTKSILFETLSDSGKELALKQLKLQEDYIACLKARYADICFNEEEYSKPHKDPESYLIEILKKFLSGELKTLKEINAYFENKKIANFKDRCAILQKVIGGNFTVTHLTKYPPTDEQKYNLLVQQYLALKNNLD